MEVIHPHYASTKGGQEKLKQAELEEQKRKLEEIRTKREQERKKREYEIKYFSSLRTIEQYKQNAQEGIMNSIDLTELYNKTIEKKNKTVSNLATSIKLEDYIDIVNTNTIKVSLNFKYRY